MFGQAVKVKVADQQPAARLDNHRGDHKRGQFAEFLLPSQVIERDVE